MAGDALSIEPGSNEAKRKEYIAAITRGDGVGLLPWQKSGLTREEIEFRQRIEERKTTLLKGRPQIQHPALFDSEARRRLLENVENAEGARHLTNRWRTIADHIVDQPDGYVAQMIEELTPWYGYGFTCPHCVDRLTQEGSGRSANWDYRKPEQISCGVCRQVYPSEAYPETAMLNAPRMGQKFSLYFNERERANPMDRSGKLAYQWIGTRPMNMSFSGMVRQSKAAFMLGAVEDLAYTYLLTGEPRYAASVVEIMDRFAHCYRNWLYHDYWNTVADCDPLYAAVNDMNLPLEFKRNLSADNYKRDTLEKARMLQTFWGAGRLFPSTDAMWLVTSAAIGYDLTYNATGADGRPLWTQEKRTKVERDLFLEWIFTGETYLGGPGKSDLHNNKVPRIYHAMAAVGRVLGLPEYCEVAMAGYEALRDHAFGYDGFSEESATYTAMYMEQTLPIVERLHGYKWPENSPHHGMDDPYRSDPKLKAIYQAPLDHLTPKLKYIPFEDSTQSSGPSRDYLEFGLKRYPEMFRGMAETLMGKTPSAWALFNLDAADLKGTNQPPLPEIYFPGWMTALLRNGAGPTASLAALNFSPDGGHRHADNLALWYMDGGERILGDLGYVSDTPHLSWIKSTRSHNLVVVDDSEQRFRVRNNPRRPRLEMMFTTPRVSAVEASSDAYAQCRDYRREIVLLKGPEGRTVLVDLFRVKGGSNHAYRVWSELASSWGKNAGLEFNGVAMPAEPPLPKVGASLKREDIYGLRDTRVIQNPTNSWQAKWIEDGRAFRFWNFTSADAVHASNGPGQQSHNPPGRRVRVVDVIREGKELESVFVAIHEPNSSDGIWPIRSARRLDVPKAGADAVALEIKTVWGDYLVLSEFEQETEILNTRFQGKVGVIGQAADGKKWFAASGATTLQRGDLGFSNQTARWQGGSTRIESNRIHSAVSMPKGFSALAEGCQNWLLINDGNYDTGFPLLQVDEDEIRLTDRFSLPATAHDKFTLPSLRYAEE